MCERIKEKRLEGVAQMNKSKLTILFVLILLLPSYSGCSNEEQSGEIEKTYKMLESR